MKTDIRLSLAVVRGTLRRFRSGSREVFVGRRKAHAFRYEGQRRRPACWRGNGREQAHGLRWRQVEPDVPIGLDWRHGGSPMRTSGSTSDAARSGSREAFVAGRNAHAFRYGDLPTWLGETPRPTGRNTSMSADLVASAFLLLPFSLSAL